MSFQSLIDERNDLRDALATLLHAVCGETGFANAVRSATGKAYPWPALDIAEEKAKKALSFDSDLQSGNKLPADARVYTYNTPATTNKLIYLCEPPMGLPWWKTDTKNINAAFSEICLMDSYTRGERPIAPGLLHLHGEPDDILKYQVPARTYIKNMMAMVDSVVIYTDLGMSNSLSREVEIAVRLGKSVELRHLSEFYQGKLREKLNELYRKGFQEGINLKFEHDSLQRIEDHPAYANLVKMVANNREFL